ncbi:hypothetical protein COEREDRAFT_79996 [Coemansia reversa NRRL 1564]|uniref:Transmembrane protein n=1 Tax=Coemansia reversa (strain ATCC 12441 / NRRL 1564) TaxID=763665 RepID=A0A2G5BGF2_COERN|nr:hypothetical protein COEREDRAFT_79996 [Coemansia reversa NRRL 1564]|eukprot:PIA18052.1 hypothetical protein COEREDRAFT_79996 [Coemansia reversa NRRL 1564]
MLQNYINAALPYALPTLVASAVVYYAVTTVTDRLSNRRRAQRQVSELETRRRICAERYSARTTNTTADVDDSTEDKQKNSTPRDPSVLRPRAPAATDRPFGSGFMTMSDLRSRISGPSSACEAGGCCG